MCESRRVEPGDDTSYCYGVNAILPHRKTKGLRDCLAQPLIVRARLASEHQAFLHQHPAALLDLLNLGDGGGEMVGLGEHGRRRIDDILYLSPDSSASSIFWPVRSLPAFLA